VSIGLGHQIESLPTLAQAVVLGFELWFIYKMLTIPKSPRA
jgi:hypothetical protein